MNKNKAVKPLLFTALFCFVCSTERLSGFGTYCDGLTKDNAHITLTAALQGGHEVNPYYTHPIQHNPAHTASVTTNDRSPIMIICQDCFWVLRTDRTAEFVNNDKYFYDHFTSDGDEERDMRRGRY